MTSRDKATKLSIIKEQRLKGLPNVLFEQYKTVSRKDKMLVYDNILKLSSKEKVAVWDAVNRIHTRFDLSWTGFEIIFDKILKPIITNKHLLSLITHKTEKNTPLL